MAKRPAKPAYPINPELETAVVARTEEDTPRLAYADWLEEHGDPDRAEFIRLQIARWGKNPADPDFVDVNERFEELCEFFYGQRSWGPQLPAGFRFDDDPHCTLDSSSAAYHRGFPYLLEFDYQYEPDFATNVATGCDQLRGTTFRGLRALTSFPFDCFRTVLDCPFGHALTALLTYNEVPSPEVPVGTVRTVLGSACAPNLVWLQLGRIRSAEDAGALAGTKALHRVQRFAGDFSCESADVKRVMSSDWFMRLRRLEAICSPTNATAFVKGLATLPDLHTFDTARLSSRSAGAAEFAAALPKAGPFHSLARLVLDWSPFGTDGCAALARAKMPKLRHLELGGELTHAGIVALAESPIFAGLSTFAIQHGLNHKALAAIANSGTATTLRSAPFRLEGATRAGLELVATRFSNLTQLSITIDADTSKKLMASDFVRFCAELRSPNLRELSVSGPMTDEAVKALLSNPTLANVRRLSIHRHTHNRITAKGVDALLTSQTFPNLVSLVMMSNALEKVLPALVDPKAHPKLRVLSGPMSEVVAKKLEAARPQLRVSATS